MHWGLAQIKILVKFNSKIFSIRKTILCIGRTSTSKFAKQCILYTPWFYWVTLHARGQNHFVCRTCPKKRCIHGGNK